MFFNRARAAAHGRNRGSRPRAGLTILALAFAIGCGGGPDVKWEPAPGGNEGPPPRAGEEGEESLGFFDDDDDEAGFSSYADALLDRYLALTPSWGRYVGLHEYDGKVADYSPAGIAKHVSVLKEAKAKLATFDAGELDDDDALDHAILTNKTNYDLFDLTQRRRHEQDPRYYTELFDVSSYINFDYAPLDQRAKALLKHEEAALAQTKHVLDNLDPVLSRPGVETAIKSYEGYAKYLRTDVKKVVSTAGEVAFRNRFLKVNEQLAKRADAIADGLRKRFLPKSDLKQHVLGVSRYKRFVRFQEGMSSLDLAAFKEQAEADLRRNKRAYLALSKKVKVTRPDRTRLLKAATDLMDKSRKFVVDKGLVTIPSDDRCVVKESPPFMRWNAAFLNMPGPYDKAKQAYYYITMPDPALPKAEQEAYIFPWGVLMATTVHEVYPGHFLHGLWQRKAPTRTQKMVDSYSFTEGWAHYVEQMMVEEGFGKDNPQNRLGQLSDALLRNCRFVVSIGIHTEGMTLEQAAKRFREDCFQDKATAREQAVRGTFDPGYFAYTVGKLQILELREELKKELGAKFELRKFHDALLGYGAPPVALIRDRVKAAMK
jgi:uncharacterized protein (DUF885 family)